MSAFDALRSLASAKASILDNGVLDAWARPGVQLLKLHAILLKVGNGNCIDGQIAPPIADIKRGL